MKRLIIHLIITVTMVMLLFSCTDSKIEEHSKGLNIELFDDIENERTIKGIMVVQKGESVSEYFNNGEELIKYNTRSVTKSIVAILIGIAIERGEIESVNMLVSDFLDLKRYSADERVLQMTLEDVLTMQSGIDYLSPSDDTLSLEEDTLDYIMSHGMSHNPGQYFNYTSYTANLLTLILYEATNQTPLEYANTYLFHPLEIYNVRWNGNIKGVQYGETGCFLSLTDMSKIGLLILNQGVYDYQDIISKTWITKMSKAQVAETKEGYLSNQYGYLYWLGNYEGLEVISASGYGGQQIIVIPGLESVIVTLSVVEGTEDQIAEHITKMENYLINQLIPKLKRVYHSE